MRILVLSSLGSDSGCYLRARYLAASLAKQGHAVRLVRPPKALPFMLDLAITLVSYFFVVLFSRADFYFSVKPYPNTLWPFLLKRFFCRRARIGVDVDDLDHGYRSGFLSVISAAFQRPLPGLCDLVTCHNDRLAEYVERDLRVRKDRIFRLGQGVDFSVFKEDSAKDSGTEDFFLKNGLTKGRTLLYTGHLNIASDLDDILEAFRIARDKVRDLRLVVAGGGPMEGHFRRLCGKMGLGTAAVFTGHLRPESVRHFMARADFCLVYYKDRPVNRYRTSMKIRECLAMARTVVANGVGDLAEFGRFVVRSGEGPEAFAKTILQAVRKGPRKNAEGRRYIERNYDWTEIGRKFSDRLGRLMKYS